MRVLASLLLAEIPPETANFAPARADYAFAIGALVLVALVPHYVAAKLLAEEKATIPRVLIAFSIQIVLGMILLGVSLSLALLPGVGIPLLAFIALLLLSFTTAGVYGFGVVKGFLYNIGTAAVMWGIFQIIIVALDPMPLRRVLFALGTQLQGARQTKDAPPAGVEQPAPAEDEPAPVDAKPVYKFASEAEARAAALKKYPALAITGSEFNRRFVELHSQFKSTMPGLVSRPDWPMVLADQVAAELGKK